MEEFVSSSSSLSFTGADRGEIYGPVGGNDDRGGDDQEDD